MQSLLSRLLREPLVHFLLLGAGLFALYSLVGNDSGARRDRIVVDARQVTRLAQLFQRTWLRPPTQAELDGLVEDHVREEILYREVRGLGLDQDDLVIRRRLRQKMEFFNDDIGAQREPNDAELQEFLDAHAEKFRIPSRPSFLQVYVKSEVGLPEHAVPLALLFFFNIGVEAGQLLFISAVFALLCLAKGWRVRAFAQADRHSWHVASAVSKPAAYRIGALAAFWVFERTLGFRV